MQYDLEVGCGTLGGFIPALLASGYHAVGVDPEAPEGPGYRQIEFERYEPPQPVDCVVASLSLHRVADLDEVLDRLGATPVCGPWMITPVAMGVLGGWPADPRGCLRWLIDLPTRDYPHH